MTIETNRLTLQSELDSKKTSGERNKLGQFATPTLLASDLLDFAKKLLPPEAPIRFLDPAVGTGSFYSALLRRLSEREIRQATGFEIDEHYGEPAKLLWHDNALDIRIEDFTKAAVPKPDELYNLIVCNPPYVRHHHLDQRAKSLLGERAAAAAGFAMNGLAGLYCYFLAIAHAWLGEDGIAGWLIPSEFMDVNYGAPVRRYLLEKVELIRIHRFDPTELQFGDALVSSAVVWFRKRRPLADQLVEFSYGGTLADPRSSRAISRAELIQARKWSRLTESSAQPTTHGLRLSDFFAIKRGIATGDNDFFILSEERIESLNLPKQFFKPILPGPRYLETDVVETNADGTPCVARRSFILDCDLAEDEVKAKFPSLWKYLESGIETAANTYLCKSRSPWYAQESRPPAPFVCTYMGRNLGAKRSQPFRFILNKSQATAANVYLLLYPKRILQNAITRQPDLLEAIWKFLVSIPSEILLGEGRVYGGGLYKMEPKELANVPAEAIAAILPQNEESQLPQGNLFRERVA